MTMGVKVYYAEISASKEMKKRQQRVMMILDSKVIPYEAIDITEPGKENDKDFMISNAKPRGDSKKVFSPQIFNGEVYCGDYEDFDMANENDVLEEFLNVPKVERKFSLQNNGNVENGRSRESSAETESKQPKIEELQEKSEKIEDVSTPPSAPPADSTTTTPAAPAVASTIDNEDDDGFNEKNVTELPEGANKVTSEGDGEVSSTTPQEEQNEANIIPPAAARDDDDVDDGIEDELSQED